jgi:uncharacterized protein YlaN (UPF0358 family)
MTHEGFVDCVLLQWNVVDREQQKVRVIIKDEDKMLKLAHFEFQIATVLQMLIISECLDIDLRNLKRDNESDLRWFLGEVVEKVKKELFT